MEGVGMNVNREKAAGNKPWVRPPEKSTTTPGGWSPDEKYQPKEPVREPEVVGPMHIERSWSLDLLLERIVEVENTKDLHPVFC